MLLTRRHLLCACGLASASALLSTAPAQAQNRTPTRPDDWLSWLRANRRHVAVALDNGQGGRIAHRAFEPQPLASAVKVVHLAGYAKAVATGAVNPDDQVRVGDWEQYYLGLDGGAHQASLRALGIPFSNGATADDPQHRVSLDDLVASMIRYSDNAATDFLRHHLGERVLRSAAARHGWPGAPVPEILGDVLRLVLGRPVSVRQYLRDPQLQLEVIGRFPDVPSTYEGQRPWARTTWSGTAAGLNRAHRSLTGVDLARGHLERALSGDLPPGVAGIGFKGGSLAGILTAGMSVRWEDGRVGSAAVLLQEVDEQRAATSTDLVRLVRQALLEPGVLREFQAALS
ncbi:serine hydrolase [Saccharothrix xinjiangensis]|uniref:Beta-lactamase n=1 Tax=Saccharothrix xinjiangensis TaxID=204798 RepID=A0ABV9YB51_9PSEU